MYLQGMTSLINGNVYSMIYELKSTELFASAILCSLLILCIYAIKNIYNNRSNFLYFLLVSSLVLTFIFYAGSDRSIDMMTTRYLTYSGVSIFALISLAYNRNIKLYQPLIFILLISGAYSNLDYVSKIDIQTNTNEVELINYLSENNLTYGYGYYWDANLITYISRENIIMRPINIDNGIIYPFRFLSSERWFDSLHKESNEYFIAYRRNNTFLNQSSVDSFISIHSPKQQLAFKEYIIYIFEPDSIMDGNVIRSEMESP